MENDVIIFRNTLIEELVVESDTVRVDINDCKIEKVIIKGPEKSVTVDSENSNYDLKA